jgi:hypothetical protein
VTPEVYICIEDYFRAYHNPSVLSLGPDFPLQSRLGVHTAPGSLAAERDETETCDCVIRLLTTSEQRDVNFRGSDSDCDPFISGAALSLFFQESRSCLRKVAFHDMALSADVCHVLATMVQLDVELVLERCGVEDDVSGAFIECLHSDRGPVHLHGCAIGTQVLANALTGDSRVTRLESYFDDIDDADMAIVFRAFTNNRGLVHLKLECRSISNDNWNVLCESLQAHSTLTSLDLRGPTGSSIGLTDEQKTHRARLLAEMVQQNTVLHTIDLFDEHFPHQSYDQQIYADMIQPYLETNRYRPHVDAITKADISLRRALLGLALQTESVRNKSNLLWMFLSGNPDVVLQSNEEGEQIVEAAASVPVEVAASMRMEGAESAPVEGAATRKRRH